MFKTDAQRDREKRLKAEKEIEKKLRQAYRSFKTKILKNCKDGKYRAMCIQAEFVQGNPGHCHQIPEGLSYNDMVGAYNAALEEYREWLRLPKYDA